MDEFHQDFFDSDEFIVFKEKYGGVGFQVAFNATDGAITRQVVKCPSCKALVLAEDDKDHLQSHI